MARLRLSSGFSVLPEETYVFEVVEVNYKEDFGKMEIKLKCKAGLHQERYLLIDNNGNINDKAMSAFSYFAKSVLNILEYEGDIDEQWLVGSHVKARVEHNIVPSKDDPNKSLTFAHLKDYVPIEEVKPNLPDNYETYFDEEETYTQVEEQSNTESDKFDLNAFLNN